MAASSLITIHISSQLRFCCSESIHILLFSKVFDHSIFLKTLSISDAIIQKTTILPLQVFRFQMNQSDYVSDTRAGQPGISGSRVQLGVSFHLILKIPYPLLECSRRGSKCNYTIHNLFTKLLDCVTW